MKGKPVMARPSEITLNENKDSKSGKVLKGYQFNLASENGPREFQHIAGEFCDRELFDYILTLKEENIQGEDQGKSDKNESN